MKTSVSAKQAEDDGQPTATVWISYGDPSIRFKVVTKPIIQRWPAANPERFNYFYAYLYVDGIEIPTSTMWFRSPQEAMVDTLQRWIQQLTEYVIVSSHTSDLFPGSRPVQVNGSTINWLIPGTHEDEKE